MKILYDHQIFATQNYGGISRYFSKLMNEFSHSQNIEFQLALRYSQNEHLIQQPHLNRYWTNRNDYFSDSCFFSNFQKKIHVNLLNHVFNNQHETVQQLKEQNFDVFHPTYYNPYFLKHLKKKPFVLVIHDMTHEVLPEYFPRSDPAHAWKMQLIRRADAIIAISELTKRDIMKHVDFNLNPDRIKVIYHGNPFEKLDDFKKGQIAVPFPYLLFVGNRAIYKNFIFMIRALTPLFEKMPELHLICAGGGIFSDSEKKMMRQMHIASRIHHFPGDDTTLMQLYRNAQAFIFPSLYEGFGLPILEAFSCECPVIASNNSSLPEVGGDAAVYFDPKDSSSLIEATERIITDISFKNSCIMKGNQRLMAFSWAESAKKTKMVYEQVACK